jgi:prepilin signal peptidase PulO-like enzyme (type II secretory pathway)
MDRENCTVFTFIIIIILLLLLFLTPWTRMLPEKLTVPHFLKKFPHFMEPES